MHNPRCTLPVFVLILTVTLMAACAPSEISINSEQTQMPEPTAWQAPAEWWTKPQVQAFSAPLFEAYALDYLVNRPEYYLNIYSQAGVTLSNWNDFRGIDTWREVFPQVVEELHNRRYIVVGDIGMISYLMDQTAAQELQPAIMRDPYGNAIEENGCLPETPCTMSYLSVFHPASQNYYLSVVKTYIDAGVDGILIDELAFGSAFYPIFNENTMLEFRQYLQDIYSPEELITLGQPYGVTDFATMDYAALVRAELPASRTSLTRQDWQWELWSTLPFYLDYQRFLRLKHHRVRSLAHQRGESLCYGKAWQGNSIQRQFNRDNRL